VWDGQLRLLTIGLILTITMVGSEALAIGAVMPDVEDELGDRWLYGWVFSAFFLGSLVGITLAGRLADRTHPWRPFAAGLLLFCGGLIAGGLAPSMIVLVGARVAQGLGAGALPATAYVCIGRAYPAAVRPRMFALLSTAWIVPGVIGPSLAAWVGDRWSWRWVFLGLVPLVVVAGSLAVRAVRRSVPDSTPQPADRTVARDAILVAAGAALLLAGSTASRWYLLAAGLVLGSMVLLPPYRRLTPVGVFRGRAGLPAAIACRGLLTFAFFSVDAFVALALRDGRGTQPRVVGVTLTVTTLLWVIGAWIQERTIVRVGPRRLVRFGFGGLACLWAVAALAVGDALPVAVLVAAFGLAGLAMGPAYAALSVTTLGIAAPGAEGRATSALQLTDVLGTSLGTGAAGALVALGDRSSAELQTVLALVFLAGALVALLGGVVARGVPARLPSPVTAG
jgi:MFS family permease